MKRITFLTFFPLHSHNNLRLVYLEYLRSMRSARDQLLSNKDKFCFSFRTTSPTPPKVTYLVVLLQVIHVRRASIEGYIEFIQIKSHGHMNLVTNLVHNGTICLVLQVIFRIF